jgi:hypothetical protein
MNPSPQNLQLHLLSVALLGLLRHTPQVIDHFLVLPNHDPRLSFQLAEPLLHTSQVGAPLHLDFRDDAAQPFGDLTSLSFFTLFDQRLHSSQERCFIQLSRVRVSSISP